MSSYSDLSRHSPCPVLLYDPCPGHCPVCPRRPGIRQISVTSFSEHQRKRKPSVLKSPVHVSSFSQSRFSHGPSSLSLGHFFYYSRTRSTLISDSNTNTQIVLRPKSLPFFAWSAIRIHFINFYRDIPTMGSYPYRPCRLKSLSTLVIESIEVLRGKNRRQR